MPSKILPQLKHLLALTARETDTALLKTLSLHYNYAPFRSSLLLTLQYTLRLLHTYLTSLLTARYETLALSIASKASQTMLPGEALVATIEAPHITLVSWCAGVDSAREVVEDVRAFSRLMGLVEIYGKGRGLWREGRRDPAVRVLEWAKLLVLGAFQGCENVAFLVKKGVLRGERWEGREKGLWRWSWRFWAGYLALEGLRLWRVRAMKFNEDFGAQGQKEEGGIGVQSKQLQERWTRDLYSALGWVPATMHFGFYDEETSPVRDIWIGLGGMLTGGIGLREVLKTA